MSPYRYIAVEGPIGAGKTTLARRLAAHWQARLLEEVIDDNPFLPRFYQDRKHYALHTQLQFLLQREEQRRQLMDTVSEHPVVADYCFDKEFLFAQLNLEGDELALYRALQRKVLPEYPLPDLLIALEVSPDTAARRIAERGLAYEYNFPDGYLRRVAEAYNEFFHHFDGAPVLIVNTDNLNLVDSDEDFELLLRCITDMQGTRSYFNKGAGA
ncbi:MULTISPECIES: deoxynucleoside kinase [Microvirgula]|uniref:Deoxynucleoside kinase n=1 Tax=Microvirgula aerodenitrificans TaxID=57480 RepID=A0A2U3TH11_9NEIS|nr:MULTISPECIES: deoxynucleoside kinase [Microvirgula]AVY92685.1 deoxynucleoside kinase [Microvirgula aerodenitrificans]RAS17424.1 deoxyadenosine/deoxycytidine kinase [Microvirgula sp. AG722]